MLGAREKGSKEVGWRLLVDFCATALGLQTLGSTDMQPGVRFKVDDRGSTRGAGQVDIPTRWSNGSGIKGHVMAISWQSHNNVVSPRDLKQSGLLDQEDCRLQCEMGPRREYDSPQHGYDWGTGRGQRGVAALIKPDSSLLACWKRVRRGRRTGDELKQGCAYCWAKSKEHDQVCLWPFCETARLRGPNNVVSPLAWKRSRLSQPWVTRQDR